MPIYEYRCRDCGEVTSFFVRAIGDPLTPVCGPCKSTNMLRQMSAFAMGRGGSAARGGPPFNGETPALDYYRDPRNIEKNVEESFSRHGLDVPDTVRETIDSARDGKLPKGMDI